jgi:hypothetical protein
LAARTGSKFCALQMPEQMSSMVMNIPIFFMNFLIIKMMKQH